MKTTKIIKQISYWMEESVRDAKADGVVYGLSGGIDSAVVGAIANKVFGNKALGLILPIHSEPKDEEDARLIADHLDLNIKKVDLDSVFNSFIKVVEKTHHRLAINNVKPRLRMTTLYYYGQKENKLVLGCSNRSEFLTGYFTKYGDTGADLLPIANVLKTDVYRLAKELNIPTAIINKSPSAGLWKSQTDEDEMGFSYDDLDHYIIHGNIDDQKIENKIKRMYNNSIHKRQFAKICKLKE